jgi:hypothetical protein
MYGNQSDNAERIQKRALRIILPGVDYSSAVNELNMHANLKR